MPPNQSSSHIPVLDLSVLVVEDNDANQKVICLMLSRLGCTMRLAGDGQEALTILTTYRPDVIIMDLHMPVMDGITAMITLREKGYTMPILVVSAQAYPEDKTRSFAAGANGFLAKPITMALLHQGITDILPDAPTTIHHRDPG